MGKRLARRLWAGLGATLALAACGGGGGGGEPSPAPAAGTAPTSVYATPAAVNLAVADVKTILTQAVAEAQARGLAATVAVSDRVGNVLAVYRMASARQTATVPTPASGTNTDLEGATVPATDAAIAKAVTAAYLSSAGNAFSTRTASEIVQPHFPPSPGALGLESGPLFGVQFSQLPCSDISRRYAAGAGPGVGPHRSPLGLSADPGGLPLYVGGTLVGGVGVEVDGVYGFNPDVTDTSGPDDEELIALAGSSGYTPPAAIRADQISVNGTTLRYLDREAGALKSDPARATPFDSLAASVGVLATVRGYYGEGGATVLAGTAFGSEASGVRKSTDYADPDIWVLSDGAGGNRYPAEAGRDGADVGSPLTAREVSALLTQAFAVMSHTRAGIRNPPGSRAQVAITVTDTYGDILGLVAAPDETLFGVDVSAQKARSVAFLSSPHAASDLLAAQQDPALASGPDAEVAGFVQAFRSFLGLPDALTGDHAYADRSLGNLSRPFFPDGQDGTPAGPLSYPIANWSPFATGLQSALVREDVVQHVLYTAGQAAADAPGQCTFLPAAPGAPGQTRLANGLQIFPGAVPIYRGNTLVGAIGVSGDGVDQDDLIAVLGAANAGGQTGAITNAPAAIRADQIVIPSRDTRLRYVSCPVSPYVDSNAQNVCQGV